MAPSREQRSRWDPSTACRKMEAPGVAGALATLIELTGTSFAWLGPNGHVHSSFGLEVEYYSF